MKSNKLENLEKKFNLAENLVTELDTLVDDLSFNDNLPEVSNEMIDDQKPEILNLNTLKEDFQLVRNSIISLVKAGQNILTSCSNLDIADLKASQLQSLAQLQVALGANIKLLMESYKDIAAIEKSRHGMSTLSEKTNNINNGQVNNIIFSGSNSELLKLINEQSKTVIDVNPS